VLVQGASANDVVEMVAFDVFSVGDTVSAKDGGNFAGNVAMAGTLGVTGVSTLGGTTVTDSNMLNIQGDGSAVNVGAVFNKTNGTAQIWSTQVRNTDNAFLVHNYTGSSTPLLIDISGAVTMPLQPAFLAQPASAQSNIAVGSFVPIVFDTERFDQNADFASNTFTAPVTGKYQFNVTLYLVDLDSASDFYQLRLVTSNRALSVVIDPDFGQDNVYFVLTFAGLVDMDASDTAHVDIRQGSGTQQTDIDNSSTFSGYLVA